MTNAERIKELTSLFRPIFGSDDSIYILKLSKLLHQARHELADNPPKRPGKKNRAQEDVERLEGSLIYQLEEAVKRQSTAILT